MEIKTTSDIINDDTIGEKNWVAVDDLILELEAIRIYHNVTGIRLLLRRLTGERE